MAHRALRLSFLAVTLAIVAFATYQPHWQPGQERYAYPVHLDEYWHWGSAAGVARTGHAEGRSPFEGPPVEPEGTASPAPTVHERGFHVFLAALQAVTAISWPILIEFLPTVIALLTALAIFVIGERWNAGVEAVLWYAAVPTTLRFLGPGFLVPITLGLFLALVGVLVTRDRSRAAAPVIAALAAAIWTIHAMAAVLLLAILIPVLLSEGRRDATLGPLAALALPTLLALPYYLDRVSGALEVQSTLPAGLASIRIVGVALFLFAGLGAVRIALHADMEVRAVGRGLALAVAGCLALIVVRNVFAWDPMGLYDRAVTALFPLAALLAGAGTAAPRARLTLLRIPPRAAAWGIAIVLLVAQGVAVGAAMARNMDQPYYEVMTPERYEQFTMVAPLLSPTRDLAYLDGRDHMGFTAVTGVRTVFTLLPGSDPSVLRDTGLRLAPFDPAAFIEHGVTVIVTDVALDDPHFVQTTPSVYLLRPDLRDRVQPPQ